MKISTDIKNVQFHFFELIKSALWDTALNEEMFAGFTQAQWEELYRLAVGGAVVSLGYDGLNRLPDSKLPARPILLKWFALSEKKKEHNRYCETVLEQIAQMYAKNEVEFILLKGLGVAQLYRNPLLRDGGDIDLLITQNYERANELLRERGRVVSEDNIKHVSFIYKRITVENHHAIAIGSASRKVLKPLFANPVIVYNNVQTPGSTCNAIYLVGHIADHFFIGGIGLRHVCDLCVLFSGGGIDLQVTKTGIQKIGAAALFARLAAIMVKYMGVEEAALPIKPVYDRLTHKVLCDIVYRGNFGDMEQRHIPQNKWAGEVNTILCIMWRIWIYKRLGRAIYFQHIKNLLRSNFKRIANKDKNR